MQQVTKFYQSSIGQKVVMAVTGVILVGFVVAHMIGNLKVYQGAHKLDAYGEFLREAGAPLVGHGQVLWAARIVLLAAVFLHIAAAARLSKMNLQARPVGYKKRQSIASTYASRTMRWGGVIIGLFVIYHILHLTTGNVHPDFQHGQVYANLVTGLGQLSAAVIYMLAALSVGLHLYHGVWSGLQTLGIESRGARDWRRLLAAGIAIAVTAGNLSFPIAVLTGIVRL
jgi:succinate dehydrogenase / fumarate reductase cytochrome b subunit